MTIQAGNFGDLENDHLFVRVVVGRSFCSGEGSLFVRVLNSSKSFDHRENYLGELKRSGHAVRRPQPSCLSKFDIKAEGLRRSSLCGVSLSMILCKEKRLDESSFVETGSFADRRMVSRSGIQYLGRTSRQNECVISIKHGASFDVVGAQCASQKETIGWLGISVKSVSSCVLLLATTRLSKEN